MSISVPMTSALPPNLVCHSRYEITTTGSASGESSSGRNPLPSASRGQPIEELAGDRLEARALALLAELHGEAKRSRNALDRGHFLRHPLGQPERDAPELRPAVLADGCKLVTALESGVRPENQVHVEGEERADESEADGEHDDRGQARSRRAPIESQGVTAIGEEAFHSSVCGDALSGSETRQRLRTPVLEPAKA